MYIRKRVFRWKVWRTTPI